MEEMEVMGKATSELAVMANQAQVEDTGTQGRVLWVSGGRKSCKQAGDGSGHSSNPLSQFLVLCSLQAVPGQHLAADTEICQYLERKLLPLLGSKEEHTGDHPLLPTLFSPLAFLGCFLIAHTHGNVRGVG